MFCLPDLVKSYRFFCPIHFSILCWMTSPDVNRTAEVAVFVTNMFLVTAGLTVLTTADANSLNPSIFMHSSTNPFSLCVFVWPPQIKTRSGILIRNSSESGLIEHRSDGNMMRVSRQRGSGQKIWENSWVLDQKTCSCMPLNRRLN